MALALSVAVGMPKFWRSVGLWILPVALRGKASTNRITQGRLKRARLASQCAWISDAANVCPGFTATIKPPKYTLKGVASFYDNGTTAMRLPAGTIIRVCGARACLDRVVNDWGPSAAITPTRIIDMYRPDFFAVCGCPSWSGVSQVTVSIY